MRKGIKILGKVISTIILLLIFFPVVATLVLNIESVQNGLVRQASRYASDYLGTDVYVDGIDFDLFSKVRIRGLYVEDYNQDTLLYVAHATANIDGLSVAKEGLRLSNTKVYGGKFYLRELPSGKMNITPIVEQLQSGEGEGDFKLYIDDIDAEELSFSLEKLEHRNPLYGVDVDDMYIGDISAHITNFAVVRGAVWMDIEHLSFVEQSGFEAEELASHLYVSDGVVALEGLNLQTQTSSIYAPKVELRGDDWLSYKHFEHDVELVMSFEHSQVALGDVAYFVPSFWGLDIDVRSLSATVTGPLSDLDVKIKRAKLGEATDVALNCSVDGLPNWRDARYVVGVERLYATSQDVLMVADVFAKGAMSEQLRGVVERLEWVDVRATGGGLVDDFRVVGNISSGKGNLSGDVVLRRVEDSRMAVLGEVHSEDLDIGDIASIKNLHTLTTNIAFDGSVGGAESGGVIGNVDILVESINYGGYTFSNIEGNGHVAGRGYLANIKSHDPNLRFDLRADIELDSISPTYIASLALRRADLNALGVNRRDSISVLSANVGVNLQGVLTDGVDGYVSIADIEYDYPDGQFVEDRVKVEFENLGDSKSIHLNSDVVTVDYSSNSTYLEASNYLYNALKHYAPLLYDSAQGEVVYGDGDASADYATLSVTAGESINDFLKAVARGLVVAPDTAFDLNIDADGNAISLRGESDAVEYMGWILADWECDVNNRSVRDSLEVKFDTDGLYYGTRSMMPNVDISGGVCNNMVDVEVKFKDEAPEGNSAMVALRAELLRNDKTKQRNVHIDLTPSYFYRGTERWDLTSQGIDIEPSRVSVSNFLIARPDQHLMVNGVISRSIEDAVWVTLNNFDISGASMLTNSIGYSIEGVANGYAMAKSALRNPEVEASIAVDSLSVNNIPVAPQMITSTWDKARKSAHLVVHDRVLNKRVIDGYYCPGDNSYNADMTIVNADMALLKPFLGSVLADIEGKVDIFANITGESDKAELSGSMLANSFAATVDYTKARYKAPTARFTVEDNHILASRIPLYDDVGNVGYLTLDVDLGNLSNVSYDITAEVNKMLVLNTTASDNDSFYGHLYATGEALIRGDRRGTSLDIDVTSADNSKFFLPLQRKEDVSYANFVKFVEPDVEKVDTIDFLTRLMMAYERRAREESEPSSLLDINIDINVLPNIDMQLVIDPTMGNVIKAKGSGELSMHILPEADVFEMNGDIKISEGTYLFTLQNIINKLFTVVPGSSIHWDGNPSNADLNIDAVYSTKASLSPLIGSSVQGFDTSHAVPVDCYIKLTGELNSPTPTFDIKIPNVAPEIQTIVQSALNDQHAIATQMFWLLAANCFSAEDTGVTGASLSATTGFELLSNQLSNWLSGEDYNIILRYRPRNNISGDEVDFGFSKSWFNNRLIVELEGGYLSDASAQAMQKASNFVGEAFITWLIDPEGVMRFRGFTQTIDRYGENQGMQESGIGFYYNESFNTFAELLQSVKNRFGGKGKGLKDATEGSEDEKIDGAVVDNKGEGESLDIIERDTLQREELELNDK